jgi:hypothetical protein
LGGLLTDDSVTVVGLVIKPFVALDYVSGFWYASGWDAIHML